MASERFGEELFRSLRHECGVEERLSENSSTELDASYYPAMLSGCSQEKYTEAASFSRISESLCVRDCVQHNGKLNVFLKRTFEKRLL